MLSGVRPLRLIAILAGLAFLALGIAWLHARGGFADIGDPYAGPCQSIDLPGPARDARVAGERGLAYLSVRDGNSAKGSVLLLDLNLAAPAPRAALRFDPADFRPEGLSLWRAPDAPARLFVISGDAQGAPAVEIAEQEADGAFTPRETVRDALFGHPVLVAAVGARAFYVVDRRWPRSAAQEQWRLLTRSGEDALIFHPGSSDSGAGATVVASGLAGVTGLAASADGHHLYVAEALARRLNVYRIEGQGLKLERRVSLAWPPGRLEVDAEGVVWLTAHPRLARYLAALRGGTEAVPSRILRFDPRQPDAGAREVMGDDGSRFSVGVAAGWRDKVLLAELSSPKVHLCQLKP